MPHRGSDRRWTWYAQVRDAVVALVGVGTLSLMAFRNSYPIGGVLTALVCVGALSASAALRALAGRWRGAAASPDGEGRHPMIWLVFLTEALSFFALGLFVGGTLL